MPICTRSWDGSRLAFLRVLKFSRVYKEVTPWCIYNCCIYHVLKDCLCRSSTWCTIRTGSFVKTRGQGLRVNGKTAHWKTSTVPWSLRYTCWGIEGNFDSPHGLEHDGRHTSCPKHNPIILVQGKQDGFKVFPGTSPWLVESLQIHDWSLSVVLDDQEKIRGIITWYHSWIPDHHLLNVEGTDDIHQVMPRGSQERG